MTRAYLYVVKSSSDPNRVTCSVPYQVDDETVFFGPCKKRLREALRSDYLGPHLDAAAPDDDIYLVGVNGGNAGRVRKVVWAGRIRRVMTFARACQDLIDAKYHTLQTSPDSPLHVRPLYEQGRLVGYRLVTSEHAVNDDWVMDLVKKYDTRYVRLEEKRLLLQPGISAWEGFPRDVCLLLENVFFATRRGLSIDQALLGILRRAQPERQIDGYAIFGYNQNGAVKGLTGNYLTLEGPVASELIQWLGRKTQHESVD
jgi:hypothetical protein